jgi:hypothetical protein
MKAMSQLPSMRESEVNTLRNRFETMSAGMVDYHAL